MEYFARKKKHWKSWIFLFLFLILLTLVFISVIVYLRTSLAPMDGELSLQNLSSPVRIIRDSEGIPHIYAQNNKDLYRAFGFTIASERLFQMEMARRMASGELAEIVGTKGLASDKMFRTFRLRSAMQEILDRKTKAGLVNPEMLQLMDAFYDGVNQYQNLGKLPVEFKILGITPRPFSALDGYSLIGLMSFSFAIATNEEPLFTKLRARLGEEWVNEMRIDKLPANDSKNPKTRKYVEKSKFLENSLITSAMNNIEDMGMPLFEGSNGWLIAGKRSSSGFPVLSNDPHISYSHPGVWFEAHLKSPNFETYGHFLPNIPFPVLAHNRERGFGFTMSLVDDMDLFKEELNPKFKTYRFKDKQLFYREYLEVIKVKGQSDVKMNVTVTQHGPILDEILPEKSLALNWVYYNPDNDALSTLYKMVSANDMAEFKAAVATGVAPGLNVLYADKKNIAWWIFGQIPLRSPHVQSDFIHDGANGNDEYKGYMSFADKPHLENPESGIIVSANARPEGFPADQRGDWQPDDRYLTIKTLLGRKETWSVDEIKELQTLSLNLENKLILDELLRVSTFDNLWQKGAYANYFTILKKWDFVSSVDSIAPSLYHTWCREISKILLRDLSHDEQVAYSKMPSSWIFFKRAMLDEKSFVWTKFDRKKVFTDAFAHTIESLKQELGEDSRQWKWGLLHTLEYTHPLAQVPLLNKIFNVGPFAVAGNFNEINNQKAAGIEGRFNVKVGPSTRRIIDFAHPEQALGILPIGESGHLLSPFYKNQAQRFIQGNYRPELLDDTIIQAQKTHEIILK
jgi:penicillin amidase